MFLVLIQAFVPGVLHGQFAFAGFEHLGQLFQRRLWRVSLQNSLYLAANTAWLGTVLALMLAMLRQRLAPWGVSLLDLCAWALLIMPSFIIAQGWILFSIKGGIADAWLGMPWVNAWVFSPQGLVNIMVLKNYPFAYLAIVAAMQWQVRDHQYAAQLCGAGSWRRFLTVRLPLLLPAILSGMLLVFIDTIGDFGLPAALATTYRFPTLPYTIFTAINQSPIRFDLAGVLSFYLMAILMLAVALYLWLLRRSRFDFLTAKAEVAKAEPEGSAWLWHLLMLVFVVCALAVPLGASLAVSVVEQLSAGWQSSNFTLQHYRTLLQPGSLLHSALINSLRIALIAAMAGAIPVAIRILLGAMAQVPASFLQSAAMQGAGLMRRLATVLLPICLAAFLSALLTSFAGSVFDLAVTSILHPPGYAVLPVVIDRLFQQGLYGQSTAATLLAAAITLALLQLTAWSVRRIWRPLFVAPSASGNSSTLSSAKADKAAEPRLEHQHA